MSGQAEITNGANATISTYSYPQLPLHLASANDCRPVSLQQLALKNMDKHEDDLDLEARGYSREMPRQFSTFSLVALSFSLTCTWSGTGSSIGISLNDASAAGTIWSLPVAAVMTAFLSAGVAELASAYPVAGAQYYWAFCLASKDWRAFASYMFVSYLVLKW